MQPFYGNWGRFDWAERSWESVKELRELVFTTFSSRMWQLSEDQKRLRQPEVVGILRGSV